jgi:kynurenine formamidase
MTWHVQYRTGTASEVALHATPESAIEAACHLIDQGVEVFGISFGSLDDSIACDQIAAIYALWVRPRKPFGI